MLMLVTREDARLAEIVRAAVDGGVNVVQVRGGDVGAICAAAAGAKVVINTSFFPLAGRRCREAADEGRHPAEFAPHPAFGHPLLGLHLPENASFEKSPFTGRSVHSVDAAVRAEQEGCDYIVAGSIFPTSSHPNGPVAGLTLIEDIARATSIAVIAIGGITAANARQCIDAGARGVAVISAIFDAQDPRRAAQDLWKAIA